MYLGMDQQLSLSSGPVSVSAEISAALWESFYYLAFPWVPMPQRLPHEASLFMHPFNFDFTLNCLILLILVNIPESGLIWLDRTLFFIPDHKTGHWSSNWLAVFQSDAYTWLNQLWWGDWNTVVLNMANCDFQQGWRSSCP